MKHFCTGLFFLLPVFLIAQYRPTIVSGRPGQSIGALTVGRGVYQVQTGLNLDWAGTSDDRLTQVTETTDLRIGLSERFELSALIAGASAEVATPTGRRYDRGFSDTQVGGRYSFFEQDGWRPTLAVRGHVLLTLQDEDFRRRNPGANVIVVAEWGLTDLLALTANLSRTWTGDDSRSTDYITTLGFALSDRWSSFVEVYGGLSGEVTANYDGGFAYLVADDLSLDLSAGWDGGDGINSYFLDFGVSFRFVSRGENP